jgi:hypothetical protein
MKRRTAMGLGPAGAPSPATFTNVKADDLEGWELGRARIIAVPANTGLALPWTAEGAIHATAEVREKTGMDRRVFIALSGSALTEPALE